MPRIAGKLRPPTFALAYDEQQERTLGVLLVDDWGTAERGAMQPGEM